MSLIVKNRDLFKIFDIAWDIHNLQAVIFVKQKKT